MDWDQVTALGALALMALTGAALLYAAVRFVWGAARWIGGKPGPSDDRPAPSRGAHFFDPTVTAADLVAIRSNLLAVTRQIEDLERRIRLSAIAASRAKQEHPEGPGKTAHAPI
jgi:hypothetical protein